ncbi:MAG TPA: carboxypeptidase-like regulatory domain-containing protein [Bryobacteraceae bacterium]|nr:carboxypeptidase-like regulatory domain-containing protein [Bryobacteraceae bacterium]
MSRVFRTLLLLSFFAAPLVNAACPCMIRFGVCDETRQSQAVFIGTVESVSPPLLDPYARANAMASASKTEMAQLRADSSPEALAKLKKIYLDLFSGIPDRARQRFSDAQTQAELEKAFESAQSEGRMAHFQVKTLYRLSGDDDDAPAAAKPAPKDDDDNAPKTLDIWTSAGDCGVDFQVGETYVVYALEDEDSGRLETSVCMRTRPLSEEAGDLAFLYYLKNGGAASTRLEGFVSTSYSDQNLPRFQDQIASPSRGALIELDDGSHPRYSQSDAEGRFVFDGLKEGDYRLSLLAPGYPRTPKTVILSRPFHAAANACVRQIFVQPAKPSSP